ncbi:hypothetical protein HB852_10735 [Listeria grandensis]|uniref:Uncharacterized protein n=1 Tax=Listeria grandensis TaxID=1494963 RepID=A0A7X0Y4U8_9LIST|nr:hypothetical protein [Listeria grandensis]MBC1475095.1 hypothetical protein [Listeria grandensis]MBC1936996.1 hypothetical protein [Listeria grandensis]
MTIFKIISSVFLVVYAILFINIMYSIIQTQEGFTYPIWIQILLALSFLAVALLNFTQKRHILGGVLTSAVLMLGISIAITSIA